ncbi:hypothetical protein ABPG75_008424 [Micractinium tetrahymenae]
MRILVASDSYGGSMAQAVVEHLRASRPDIEVEDRGVQPAYYTAAYAMAAEVEAAAAAGLTDTRAVLCCGSGQGMCIVANKFLHVYAALCTTPEAAAGCRSVNNANVLCLGGRVTRADDGRKILDAWLATELGEGWEPPIQEFIRTSMAEIPALDFSPAAAARLATAAAAERQRQHAQPAEQVAKH